MSPDGSETKFKKEMAKQPLTLTIRIASGVHTGIEDIHCVNAKRIRLPIPPPIATKEYLLIKTIRYKWSRQLYRSAGYRFSKRLVSIVYHLYSLERDQATAHHWLQMRKESIDLFLRIDDLDNHWQIRRKSEDLRSMHMTRPPETEKTSKHCGTCQLQLSCFQNDRFVKRQMLLTIILANKNP